jgi:hypothetical protein
MYPHSAWVWTGGSDRDQETRADAPDRKQDLVATVLAGIKTATAPQTINPRERGREPLGEPWAKVMQVPLDIHLVKL